MGIKVPPPFMPTTIQYIRTYLEDNGEGNPYTVFLYARERAVQAVHNRAMPWMPAAEVDEIAAAVRRGVNYRSIIRYFYILRELELIEHTRSEPSGRGQPKNFYRIIPGREHLLQAGIQYQLYPWTYYGRRYNTALEEMPIPFGRSDRSYPPKHIPPLRAGEDWTVVPGPWEEE